MSAGVRPAIPADAPAIAGVHVRAWRETYTGMLPPEMVAGLTEAEALDRWTAKTARDSGTQVFVAELGGAIVGFSAGCAATDTDMESDGVLDFLYMVEAGHGRGLGRALTEAVAADLHGHGHRTMGVIVHADNPALQFYQAMGGAIIAERVRDHRGFDCPEVLLRWDLPLSSEA